jgi:hypothetical protein
MSFRISGRLLVLALFAASAIAGPSAAGGLTPARVRGYLASQEAAWNSGRLEAYFAGFTSDAVFVEQTRTPKETISYGRSSLSEARTQARRSRRQAASTEQSAIRSIVIAADGRSARVLGDKVTRFKASGRVGRSCAQTDQTLVLVGGEVRSKGGVDTLVRCRTLRP